MLHKVKLLSGFYQAVIDGIKPFEIRYNDRNYKRGDDVIFNEWKDDAYTGRLCCAVIKDVFDIGFLMPGYVAFTFQILGRFETIEQSDAKNSFAKDIEEASDATYKILFEETKAFVEENHRYSSKDDFDKAHIKNASELQAEALMNKGYCKATETINGIFQKITNELFTFIYLGLDGKWHACKKYANKLHDFVENYLAIRDKYTEDKECTIKEIN